MKFNSFFNYDELTSFLKQVAREYPHIFSLSSLAETESGHQIWCLEATDKEIYIPEEYRSGFYIQGNMHAMEFAGSMQCIYFIEYIIENHRSDSILRDLLKRRIFYIVPRVAVDGTEYMFDTLSAVRCKHIDHDDRVMIKKDMNNDGRILTMRWRSPYGSFKISDKDERLMLPIDESDTSVDSQNRYMLAVEGVLNAGKRESDIQPHTFKHGEDYLDFNRNFPTNWVKISGVNTGDYPLSELETRAIADFIIAHPNIIQVLDFHTGNPAIFYPDLLGEHNLEYREDWEVVKRIGKKGEKITGFKLLSGYAEETTGKPAPPLPGCFKDWLYEDRGIMTYIVELGLLYNYMGVPRYCEYGSPAECEEVTGRVLLKWHEQHPEAELFFDWMPFNHPQFGEVEIGGWNWTVYSNPPLTEMEGVCKRSTEFTMEMAKWMPRLTIENIDVEKIDEDIFKVSMLVADRGNIKARITQMRREKNPCSIYANVHSKSDMEFIIGHPKTQIQNELIEKGISEVQWLVKTETREFTFEVFSRCGIHTQLVSKLK